MKLSEGALSMLLKRYRSVLNKCTLRNMLACTLLAGSLALGASGALALTLPDPWNSTQIVSSDETLGAGDNDYVYNPSNIGDDPYGIVVEDGATLTLDGAVFKGGTQTSGGLIEVQSGGTLEVGAGGLTIDGNKFVTNPGILIQEGAQAHFSGPGAINISNNSFYKVSSPIISNYGEMSLNGVVFNANSSKDKGSLYNNGQLSIDASNFIKDNYRSYDSVLYNDVKGEMSITNSTFSGDRVATSNQYSGAQITNLGKLEINSSIFEKNTIRWDGGALKLSGDGKVVIKNTEFTDNRAFHSSFMNPEEKSRGGAIFAEGGSLDLEDVTFTNNTAESGGGAIWSSVPINISGNSKFEGNEVMPNNINGVKEEGYGNAISLDGFSGTSNITGAEFINNGTASTSYGGIAKGGAIYINGASKESLVNIIDSKFSGGGIAGDGQVIYVQKGQVNIEGSSFTNIISGNVIVLTEDAEANIKSSVFNLSPESSTLGGKSIANSGILKISENSTFENNISYGALVLEENSTNIIKDSTFSDNMSKWTPGGAINTKTGNLEISGAKFVYNKADLGGAIYINAADDKNTVTITSTVFQENVSTQTANIYTNQQVFRGGAITNNTNMNIRDSEFIQNRIDSVIFDSETAYKGTDGGAIYNTGSLVIDNTKFSENELYGGNTGHGGAIYNDGSLQVNNSNFQDNKFSISNGEGGAIYNGENGKLVINDTTFINTDDGSLGLVRFGKGGAIANYGTLEIDGQATVFKTNHTYGQGGAIAVLGQKESSISNVTFEDNRAYEHTAGSSQPSYIARGGAIYNTSPSLLISNSKFLKNSAQEGNAIYNLGDGATAQIVISDSTFTENKFFSRTTTAEYGGTIVNDSANNGKGNIIFKGQNAFSDNSSQIDTSAVANDIYNTAGSEIVVADGETKLASGQGIINLGKVSVDEGATLALPTPGDLTRSLAKSSGQASINGLLDLGENATLNAGLLSVTEAQGKITVSQTGTIKAENLTLQDSAFAGPGTLEANNFTTSGPLTVSGGTINVGSQINAGQNIGIDGGKMNLGTATNAQGTNLGDISVASGAISFQNGNWKADKIEATGGTVEAANSISSGALILKGGTANLGSLSGASGGDLGDVSIISGSANILNGKDWTASSLAVSGGTLDIAGKSSQLTVAQATGSAQNFTYTGGQISVKDSAMLSAHYNSIGINAEGGTEDNPGHVEIGNPSDWSKQVLVNSGGIFIITGFNDTYVSQSSYLQLVASLVKASNGGEVSIEGLLPVLAPGDRLLQAYLPEGIVPDYPDYVLEEVFKPVEGGTFLGLASSPDTDGESISISGAPVSGITTLVGGPEGSIVIATSDGAMQSAKLEAGSQLILGKAGTSTYGAMKDLDLGEGSLVTLEEGGVWSAENINGSQGKIENNGASLSALNIGDKSSIASLNVDNGVIASQGVINASEISAANSTMTATGNLASTSLETSNSDISSTSGSINITKTANLENSTIKASEISLGQTIGSGNIEADKGTVKAASVEAIQSLSLKASGSSAADIIVGNAAISSTTVTGGDSASQKRDSSGLATGNLNLKAERNILAGSIDAGVVKAGNIAGASGDMLIENGNGRGELDAASILAGGSLQLVNADASASKLEVGKDAALSGSTLVVDNAKVSASLSLDSKSTLKVGQSLNTGGLQVNGGTASLGADTSVSGGNLGKLSVSGGSADILNGKNWAATALTITGGALNISGQTSQLTVAQPSASTQNFIYTGGLISVMDSAILSAHYSSLGITAVGGTEAKPGHVEIGNPSAWSQQVHVNSGGIFTVTGFNNTYVTQESYQQLLEALVNISNGGEVSIEGLLPVLAPDTRLIQATLPEGIVPDYPDRVLEEVFKPVEGGTFMGLASSEATDDQPISISGSPVSGTTTLVGGPVGTILAATSDGALQSVKLEEGSKLRLGKAGSGNYGAMKDLEMGAGSLLTMEKGGNWSLENINGDQGAIHNYGASLKTANIGNIAPIAYLHADQGVIDSKGVINSNDLSIIKSTLTAAGNISSTYLGASDAIISSTSGVISVSELANLENTSLKAAAVDFGRTIASGSIEALKGSVKLASLDPVNNLSIKTFDTSVGDIIVGDASLSAAAVSGGAALSQKRDANGKLIGNLKLESARNILAESIDAAIVKADNIVGSTWDMNIENSNGRAVLEAASIFAGGSLHLINADANATKLEVWQNATLSGSALTVNNAKVSSSISLDAKSSLKIGQSMDVGDLQVNGGTATLGTDISANGGTIGNLSMNSGSVNIVHGNGWNVSGISMNDGTLAIKGSGTRLEVLESTRLPNFSYTGGLISIDDAAILSATGNSLGISLTYDPGSEPAIVSLADNFNWTKQVKISNGGLFQILGLPFARVTRDSFNILVYTLANILEGGEISLDGLEPVDSNDMDLIQAGLTSGVVPYYPDQNLGEVYKEVEGGTFQSVTSSQSADNSPVQFAGTSNVTSTTLLGGASGTVVVATSTGEIQNAEVQSGFTLNLGNSQTDNSGVMKNLDLNADSSVNISGNGQGNGEWRIENLNGSNSGEGNANISGTTLKLMNIGNTAPLNQLNVESGKIEAQEVISTVELSANNSVLNAGKEIAVSGNLNMNQGSLETKTLKVDGNAAITQASLQLGGTGAEASFVGGNLAISGLASSQEAVELGDLTVGGKANISSAGPITVNANNLSIGSNTTDSSAIYGGVDLYVADTMKVGGSLAIGLHNDSEPTNLTANNIDLSNGRLIFDPDFGSDGTGNTGKATIGNLLGDRANIDVLQNYQVSVGTNNAQWLSNTISSQGLTFGRDIAQNGRINSALGLYKPVVVPDGGAIMVDGSHDDIADRQVLSAADQNKVYFGEGSLLVVNGNAEGVSYSGKGRTDLPGAISAEKVAQATGSATGAKLMISGIKPGNSYVILGKGIVAEKAKTTRSTDNASWTGSNLLSDDPIIRLVNISPDTVSGQVQVYADIISAAEFFPSLDGELVNVIDSAMLAGEVHPFYGAGERGAAFLSRALSASLDGYGASAAATIESAARMAAIGAVPQMTRAANEAAGAAVISRLSMSNPGWQLMEQAVHGSHFALWIMPLYQSTNGFGMEAGNFDYDFSGALGGVTLGADYTFEDCLRAGLLFNIGGGYAKGSGDLNKTTNNMSFWGIGAYAGWAKNNFSLAADVNYTSTYNKLKQELPENMYMSDLKSDITASAISAGLRFAYKFNTDYLDIEPHAAFRYTNLNIDSYDVKSNGTVINGDSFSQNIWTFPIGLSFSKDFELNNGWKVTPLLDLNVTPAAGDIKAKSKIHFTGVGQEAELDTKIMDYVTYGGTAGVSFGNDTLSFGINYNGQFGAESSAHGVFATFRYEF